MVCYLPFKLLVLREQKGGHMKKTKWEKPKLIVLLKGNPEENVLAACKSPSGITGPQNSYRGCQWSQKFGCKKCNNETAS